MSYFTTDFQDFFRELSGNNTTDWFNANRKRYEKDVKKPFADFVEEMIARIREQDPEVQIKASDAITRINKDIRFSKDKTPYNTYVSAIISAKGKKDKSWPGIYIQLSHEGIQVYGGAYMLEPAVLQQVRSYIADHLKAFSSAINDTAFKEKFGNIQGEQHKRVPPEFQTAAQSQPLIANKQFYFSAELKPSLLNSPTLADTLMEYFRAARPVNDFLKQALAL